MTAQCPERSEWMQAGRQAGRRVKAETELSRLLACLPRRFAPMPLHKQTHTSTRLHTERRQQTAPSTL